MSLRLLSAKIQSHDNVLLAFNQRIDGLSVKDFSITPHIKIFRIDKLEHLVLLHTDTIDIKKQYTVFVKSIGNLLLQPDGIFDEYTSQKSLGYTRDGDAFVFRLFAPRAQSVYLIIYSSVEDQIGTEFEMTQDSDGVWEIVLDAVYVEKYYCYKVFRQGIDNIFDSSVAIADPYSKCVARKNNYMHDSRSMIVDSSFDWGGDTWIIIRPSDLIIYEMHIGDMSSHPSSGVDEQLRGKYLGLIGSGNPIKYISSLGVNAVELLPVQEFATFEPPYKQLVGGAMYNTWNPYERNHWGYMTSFYFAPHSYYASERIQKKCHFREASCGDERSEEKSQIPFHKEISHFVRNDNQALFNQRPKAHLKSDSWCNEDGNQVHEFKEMVKAFHHAGIAVIMDVVYNHTSQYDHQPLKYIDRHYYYHVDEQGKYLTASGCGNDFNTERSMTRRLIIDSILHWMTEYHIDGFRFDLAAMIDWDTMEEIIAKTRQINPNVILIAEPWGGGTSDLTGYSQRGMAAWNDIYRNEVKGHNPVNALGFIFGTWQTPIIDFLQKWVLGTTQKYGGVFLDSSHSVNYLEAHDGYTLGDFIRIASGVLHEKSIITDVDAHAKLTPKQMRFNKFAAFMLMICKGIPMINEGQEFARSKVIAKTNVPDAKIGRMDQNSYEKDDETNWINYRHAEMNAELVAYYQGMMKIRNRYSELRLLPDEKYSFFPGTHHLAGGFSIRSTTSDDEMMMVLVNSSQTDSSVFDLPTGLWNCIADDEKAGIEIIRKGLTGKVEIPMSSGMIFI